MTTSPDVTLFHSPNSRSAGALTLLEELGIPYKLHVLNMHVSEQRDPAYLAINPMGKVPAIKRCASDRAGGDLHLPPRCIPPGRPSAADRRPAARPLSALAGLLRILFEPAVVDKAMKREPAMPRMNPYGDFDTMLKTLLDQLRKGPYILGDRFSAADVLWGTALTWTTSFNLVPSGPEIRDYLARWQARPSFAKVKAKDAELAAQQQAAPA